MLNWEVQYVYLSRELTLNVPKTTQKCCQRSIIDENHGIYPRAAVTKASWVTPCGRPAIPSEPYTEGVVFFLSESQIFRPCTLFIQGAA